MEAPPPGEWHPWYAGKSFLADWLDGKPSYTVVQIPVFRPLRASWTTKVEVDPAELTFHTITMTRRKAWGPAPYVGRPFHYEWPVGVDNHGRCIAGQTRIVYHDVLAHLRDQERQSE